MIKFFLKKYFMHQYPFTAIVGQQKLKQALLLCAVNPGIGGVLIKGEKGTAKTTAARGLSSVMPPIPGGTSTFFNETGQVIGISEHQMALQQSGDIPVPFVDLPLGASEDRILGSLDLEAIISEKKRKFLPGLLAEAHRGILYIDEVNLLADHLVDVLLDVAASGVNTVQREGLSVSHPSKFVLIGTMNPEEGNLRPQFLDRFGLMVEVESQLVVNDRTEVVRRRMAFETDPDAFISRWLHVQLALQQQIKNAQHRLKLVTMPEGLLTLISQLCIEWSVPSLRADIVLYKTAITLAALSERTVVNTEDIRQAAALVLIHRKGKKPFEQNRFNDTGKDENLPVEKSQKPTGNSVQSLEGNAALPDASVLEKEDDGDASVPKKEEETFGMGPETEISIPKMELPIIAPEPLVGRHSKARGASNGFQVRAARLVSATDIAVFETIQHAVFRNPEDLRINEVDLHQKVRNGKTGHLILFVVDASGSMAAGKRMEAVKGSVMSLLKNAYEKRDMVGVISFRGLEAEILLEPTRSTDLAEKSLEKLPTGGRTPLAHAMQLAQQVLNRCKIDGNIRPILIILSDGKANVPLTGGGDGWAQTLDTASAIRQMEVLTLVLDTESGYLRFGRALELAKVLGAECLSLEQLTADKITDAVSGKMEFSGLI